MDAVNEAVRAGRRRWRRQWCNAGAATCDITDNLNFTRPGFSLLEDTAANEGGRLENTVVKLGRR